VRFAIMSEANAKKRNLKPVQHAQRAMLDRLVIALALQNNKQPKTQLCFKIIVQPQ